MSVAPPETVGCVLGVDVGSVRVGVAASDPTGTIAIPLVVLRRDDRELWSRLQWHARDRTARLVVVGLPRRLDGSEGEMAGMAREFAAAAEQRLGLASTMWDERFTSQQAERSLIQQGVRRERRRQSVDAVAASLMLQSWLDSQGRR